MVTFFSVFGRRERWRRESLTGAEGSMATCWRGKAACCAPALPMYRCSPAGVRGWWWWCQSGGGDPGCSQEGSGVTGSPVPRLDRRVMQLAAARSIPASPRRTCYIFHRYVINILESRGNQQVIVPDAEQTPRRQPLSVSLRWVAAAQGASRGGSQVATV